MRAERLMHQGGDLVAGQALVGVAPSGSSAGCGLTSRRSSCHPARVGWAPSTAAMGAPRSTRSRVHRRRPSMGADRVGIVFVSSLAGDHEQAWARIDALLAEPELKTLNTPPIHMAPSLLVTALAAARIGHRAAGERLRPLIEPLRAHVVYNAPSVAWGHVPQLAIGMLEDLAGRHESAVAELHDAVEIADAAESSGPVDPRSPSPGHCSAAATSRRQAASWPRPRQSRKQGRWHLPLRGGRDSRRTGRPPAGANCRPRPTCTGTGVRHALEPPRAGRHRPRPGRRDAGAAVPSATSSAGLLRAMARGFQPGLANGSRASSPTRSSRSRSTRRPTPRGAGRSRSGAATPGARAGAAGRRSHHVLRAGRLGARPRRREGSHHVMSAGRCRVEGDLIVASCWSRCSALADPCARHAQFDALAADVSAPLSR